MSATATSLQNRVDPFGAIHAVSDRGLFMGNRGGRIRNAATKTLTKRRHVSKAWIICLCAFKGRRRSVMGRGYTELFFLDEATALAAGHRPCFECRRQQATEFATYCLTANELPGHRASDIDARLHQERLIEPARRPRLGADAFAGLPDGSMVARGKEAYLILQGAALRWSFAGYQRAELSFGEHLRLLTPPSTVNALAAGYRPVLHESAGMPA